MNKKTETMITTLPTPTAAPTMTNMLSELVESSSLVTAMPFNGI